jgi:uncharacterized delta-60 repeat protein
MFLLAAPGVAWAAFAGDGYETVNFGAVDGANALAVQKDKGIVLAGSTSAFGTFDFGVARFTKDGAIDGTFSGDGRQTTAFSDFDGANDVAIQKNGRIVAAGSDDNSKFALARYRANGKLDKTFSGDGKATTGFPGGGVARAMAIQKDGRIVTVGSQGDADEFAVARFKENGKLDKSFSGNGKATVGFGGHEVAHAVALQENGRIVVGGSTCKGAGMCVNDDFALARLKENGKLDKSFSGDGKRTLDIFGGGFSDRIEDLAIQDNGRIVAAGVATSGGSDVSFAVARFKPSGDIDRSFSGNGHVLIDFTGTDVANSMVLQPDGRIVLAGSTDVSGVDIALARLKENGEHDASFSGDGKLIQPIGVSASTAADVAMLGHKHIVTGGLLGASNDFLVVRFNTDGTLAD